MSKTLIKTLHDEYRTTVEAAKGILVPADTEKRTLTAEEEASWTKANGDIDRAKRQLETAIEDEKRTADAAELETRVNAALAYNAEAPTAPAGTPAGDTDAAEKRVRAFLRGETRELDVKPEQRTSFNELRSLVKGTTTAGGFTVKTSFYAQLMTHLIEVSGILSAGATVLQTDSGEAIQVPKTTAHSSASLIAEGAAISASDPTFGQATLNAYKYAVLIQVARELVDDTSVDLMGYIAMQAGRAVGNAFGVHAITGDGSSKPYGVVTNSTLGVTGDASVVGVFTADNLIDLYYSVIAPYRASSACGWLMRDATLAKARKLKDTTGQYLWQPSYQAGTPETLLGKPVHTDPNVAATALAAKSVIFGDISQYMVRQVNGLRFERSDDYAFNTDLVTFRCIARLDGVLVDQTGAVKHFIGNAA